MSLTMLNIEPWGSVTMRHFMQAFDDIKQLRSHFVKMVLTCLNANGCCKFEISLGNDSTICLPNWTRFDPKLTEIHQLV